MCVCVCACVRACVHGCACVHNSFFQQVVFNLVNKLLIKVLYVSVAANTYTSVMFEVITASAADEARSMHIILDLQLQIATIHYQYMGSCIYTEFPLLIKINNLMQNVFNHQVDSTLCSCSLQRIYDFSMNSPKKRYAILSCI